MRTKIRGISITQNEQEFIIGKLSIQDIIGITRYTKRLIIGYDEDEKPIYNNRVQRDVESSRVKKIADYLINDPEATFPTNIVLGVPINIIEEQYNAENFIEITLKEVVAQEVDKYAKGDDNADIFVTIIDGQHRIKGIEMAIKDLELSINGSGHIVDAQRKLENLLNIELLVSYFIDKSLEYQAMIFSTINRTQKRVSQDLVYSLFGLSTDDTPYKTALEVVLALNGHPKSPFYKRIRLYGGSYDKYTSPPLSQATMIKSIVALISENLRESENDKYKKRKDLLKQTGKKYLPFRSFYANNQDYKISDCLFHFFNAVKINLSEYWEYDGISKPVNILQSTYGFEILLKLLASILKENPDIEIFDSNTFDKYISKLTSIVFSDMIKYPMITRTKKRLYLEMYLLALPNASDCDKKIEELQSILDESEQTS